MFILHVLPADLPHIYRHYLRFVQTCFDRSGHRFVLLGQGAPAASEEWKGDDHVTCLDYDIQQQRRELLRLFDESRKIILHSLFFPVRLQLHFLLHPCRLRKLVWVSWGGDLYGWEKGRRSLRKTVGYRFRKKIRCFVGIFEPDIARFHSVFHSNAKTYHAGYPVTVYSGLDRFSERSAPSLSEKLHHERTLNILIGHSAEPELHHLKVIENLSRFKDRAIQLYIPLSYGDRLYGDAVRAKAAECFGEQAVCLREKMPLERYLDFLFSMDIAVFDTDRQIALGNIHPLLFMEKKIYMPQGSVMYDHFSAHGVLVSDSRCLASCSYEEFTAPVDTAAGKAYVLDNELSLQHFVAEWSAIFDKT